MKILNSQFSIFKDRREPLRFAQMKSQIENSRQEGFTPLERCRLLLASLKLWRSGSAMERNKTEGSVMLPSAGREAPVLTGFTLLEMVVSFGIFSVVIIAAIGVVLAINSAQIKAVNIQNIADNLRFALESMTKEMRTGTNFLPRGSVSPGIYSGITFTRSDGSIVGYCLQDTALRKIDGPGVDCSPSVSVSDISDESVVIERLIFLVTGEAAGGADGQPRVTISMSARSRNAKLATTFQLETTVTQRQRDQ